MIPKTIHYCWFGRGEMPQLAKDCIASWHKHMLWQLGDYEPMENSNAEYKLMVDNLRTYNMMDYMLDRRYRAVARTELAKVDWSRKPTCLRRLYHLPVWILNIRRCILKEGSCIKQRFIRCFSHWENQ